MGYSEFKIKNDAIDGDVLIIGGETSKGGTFVARITDLDKKYKYKREFLGRKERDRAYKGIEYTIVKLADLKDGDLLDIAYGGSWKNRYRGYYVYENEEFHLINEEELRKRLADKLKQNLEG